MTQTITSTYLNMNFVLFHISPLLQEILNIISFYKILYTKNMFISPRRVTSLTRVPSLQENRSFPTTVLVGIQSVNGHFRLIDD